ncbi:MAG: MFS transporter [Candidatus Omnitrophica bacterium]|nr:MFS transporter [Candidatus Omnitrophota bacterium]
MQKPSLSIVKILNMSLGFFGIQFGWGLQMANMSAIYEFLGAKADQIPILWLAAPLTGLLVQPVVGFMSDRTWGPLGRRRPYFLGGAIFASLALVLMPHSSTVWMAALLLWILDFSVNISMEPFRAFVGDILPDEQRARGFAMQSLMIGLGAVLASSLPWMMTNWFGISSEPLAKEAVDTVHESLKVTLSSVTGNMSIPETVRYSFAVGAIVFISAVLWTVISTKEYPPEDMAAFRRSRSEKKGLKENAWELARTFREMPDTMKDLGWVQLFTWFGLFCMWIYFSVAVAHNIFGAADHTSKLFSEGIQWGGVCFSVYNAVCFVFSFFLIWLSSKVSPKTIHTACLTLGGAGLLSIAFIHDKTLLLVPMVGIGIAWASIVSMPYAILAGSLPSSRMGVYMGIFNFFIVIPQIVASLGLGILMRAFLRNNSMAAVVLGGFSMLIAALLVLRVRTGRPSKEAAVI